MSLMLNIRLGSNLQQYSKNPPLLPKCTDDSIWLLAYVIPPLDVSINCEALYLTYSPYKPCSFFVFSPANTHSSLISAVCHHFLNKSFCTISSFLNNKKALRLQSNHAIIGLYYVHSSIFVSFLYFITFSVEYGLSEHPDWMDTIHLFKILTGRNTPVLELSETLRFHLHHCTLFPALQLQFYAEGRFMTAKMVIEICYSIKDNISKIDESTQGNYVECNINVKYLWWYLNLVSELSHINCIAKQIICSLHTWW